MLSPTILHPSVFFLFFFYCCTHAIPGGGHRFPLHWGSQGCWGFLHGFVLHSWVWKLLVEMSDSLFSHFFSFITDDKPSLFLFLPVMLRNLCCVHAGNGGIIKEHCVSTEYFLSSSRVCISSPGGTKCPPSATITQEFLFPKVSSAFSFIKLGANLLFEHGPPFYAHIFGVIWLSSWPLQDSS